MYVRVCMRACRYVACGHVGMFRCVIVVVVVVVGCGVVHAPSITGAGLYVRVCLGVYGRVCGCVTMCVYMGMCGGTYGGMRVCVHLGMCSSIVIVVVVGCGVIHAPSITGAGLYVCAHVRVCMCGCVCGVMGACGYVGMCLYARMCRCMLRFV